MNELKNLCFNPFFGIMLSLLCFQLGKICFEKTKSIFCNPLLLGIIFSILFLVIFKIPYEAYNKGGSILKLLISPIATVVIGVSLHEQFKVLKKNWLPIIISVFVGSIFAILVVYGLGVIAGFEDVLHKSTLPKSVTTAVALDIASKFGWEGSLVAIMTVVTGVTGAVIAPWVVKFIKSPVAKGLAIGTASHVVGTSKALELGEVEGAMSGLSVGLAAISTSFILPILLKFL